MKAHNHLGVALSQILLENKMKPADLAKLSGIFPSTLSRIIHGKLVLNADTLEALLSAFPNKKAKAHLAIGYLKDLVPASTGKLISIHHDTAGKPNLDRLSKHGAEALMYLLAAEDGVLEPFLIHFAKVTGWKPGD